jgi:hypothetical protein
MTMSTHKVKFECQCDTIEKAIEIDKDGRISLPYFYCTKCGKAPLALIFDGDNNSKCIMEGEVEQL